MKKNLFILSFCFFFYGCPLEKFDVENDSNIVIVNNSNIDLFCDVILKDSLTIGQLSPYEANYIHLREKDSRVNKNSIKNLEGPYKHWIDISPKKRIYVYFFSRDSMYMLPLEEVAKRQVYLKRIDLVMDSISNNVWTVSYP
jgi:hypothetical protein